MVYEVAWIIIGIFFWVLIAAAVVCGFVEAFIKLNYYKWDKEDRTVEKILEKIDDKVEEIKEQNSGGN